MESSTSVFRGQRRWEVCITQNPNLCTKVCRGDTELLGSQDSRAARCPGSDPFKQLPASILQAPNPLLIKPQFRGIHIWKPKATRHSECRIHPLWSSPSFPNKVITFSPVPQHVLSMPSHSTDPTASRLFTYFPHLPGFLGAPGPIT